MVAYDKVTGKIKWSARDDWGCELRFAGLGEDRGSGLVIRLRRRRQPTADRGALLAIDPRAGRITGRFPWRAKRYESVNAATPLVIGNTVFITAAYRTGGALLEVQADGQLKSLWTTQEYKAPLGDPGPS